DPIIVFLDFCPDVSPSVDDIMRKAENSTMPNLKSGNGTGVTSVLPLRKEEIKCLVNQANELKIFSSQAFVTLPVNLCKR
ncbi:MAG: hypothetical protein AAAB35_22985, partial [Phyllobacterium sp.]|uniref:hypothetical protein n=1 Tax=Phyllobacterium sp. TaxID=1871046 RepID=UPI0030F196AE